MRGVPIEIGDLIAIPVMSGRSAFMRVGRVTELVPPKDYTEERIRVDWLYGATYSLPKSSLITCGDRGMVLPDDFPTTKLGMRDNV